MTAQEFLKRDESGVYSEQDITHAMIEFAKFHVCAALSCAQEASLLEFGRSTIFNQQAILKSYPLTNIK